MTKLTTLSRSNGSQPPITADTTVGEIVRAKPDLSRVFERLGIDYCCGGKKSLSEACQPKGFDPATVVAMLAAFEAIPTSSTANADAMSLTALCDHIQNVHHAFLRDELPRLDLMTRKVAAVHGEHEPRLREIREVFQEFSVAMATHTLHEEEHVFPAIRRLDTPNGKAETDRAILREELTRLESDHERAGAVLERFRELTDGYTPPEWACNTFRALYEALAELERETHLHVHKENNILFPRAAADAV